MLKIDKTEFARKLITNLCDDTEDDPAYVVKSKGGKIFTRLGKAKGRFCNYVAAKNSLRYHILAQLRWIAREQYTDKAEVNSEANVAAGKLMEELLETGTITIEEIQRNGQT